MIRNGTSSNNLPIESIVPNIPYSFTLAPSDEYQYWNQDDRLKNFHRYWRLYFRRYKNINIYLHMEISKLGRLHYHGCIRFVDEKSILEFYVHYIRKLSERATFEIDTMVISEEDGLQDSPYICDECDDKETNNKVINKFPKAIVGNEPLHKIVADYTRWYIYITKQDDFFDKYKINNSTDKYLDCPDDLILKKIYDFC